MRRLSTDKRVQLVAALVEGNSIRATCRMCDVAKGTVLKLLRDLGAVCEEYQRQTIVNVPARRVQCDEIWSFCYAKAKNVPEEYKGIPGYGDIWTWVALDPEAKLVLSWLVGSRDGAAALAFMEDVSRRLKNRVQLTTDGNSVYLEAVESAFGCDIDYAMLVKIYGQPAEPERRYSPAECLGCRKSTIAGNPDQAHISTSLIERQNLTMRMGMRRFTRLTNGFSKKVENLEAAVNLHFMYYNFVRVHQTLRVTPAMEAGIASRLWTISDIVGLLG